MSCPQKYRNLEDFHRYYSGEVVAPVLTLVIGGNHESSGYMWELFHGGWLAPNIYFLGVCGVVEVFGIRIGGLSGIYKRQDYEMNHYEVQPFSYSHLNSVYHVRKFDIDRLLLLERPLDIILSHDWPTGIWEHGDLQTLLRKKPFLKPDIDNNRLGNPGAMQVLKHCVPNLWFAAHHHIKFEATVQHNQNSNTKHAGKVTNFMALDKCGNHRSYFHIMKIEGDKSQPLKYDTQWLAILRATNTLITFSVEKSKEIKLDTDKLEFEQQWIRRNVKDFKVPENFQRTAPTQIQIKISQEARKAAKHIYLNPQTQSLCELLGIENHFNQDGKSPFVQVETAAPLQNSEEIKIDDFL